MEKDQSETAPRAGGDNVQGGFRGECIQFRVRHRGDRKGRGGDE